MGAESSRHVRLVGLEVTDDDSYARYRAGMTPILESYGGAFGVDLLVAQVLKGDARINRVFSLSFPDRVTQDRFFADERYLAVRREFFAPAVGHAATLAEFDEPVSR
ncbi:MAG TPA: DUF1330 domain-containing protein [Candidatus Binatia bacterium]|jgi:uncharacterized protein (DUF1330 family)|nr:DUF1330 domain-containing protein [Candidatus Binatia bacterium]